jgi:hypothetical protein
MRCAPLGRRARHPHDARHLPLVTMKSSRRDFLQRSASAAAVLSLGPLASDATAEALEAAPVARDM